MAERIAGRFRLEREVGGGGMGTVHRAVDEVTGKTVAVKLMHSHLSQGPNRLAREASALAKLAHPGIVGYVAHGPSFIAMEWLEGEDLATRLRGPPLSIDEALALAMRLTDALAHAHRLGIVHRDVKPSNIVLEHGELSRPRIVDFGLAWIADDDEFHTSVGALLGTPGYMAPEQIRQLGVDARTDLFAIACVLYRCLTGRVPFGGGDALATLAKVLFDEPLPASRLRPGIPAALDGILARALSKEPELRPQSAEVLSQMLAKVEVGGSDDRVVASAPVPARALTERELRVVSVVVAARSRFGDENETLSEERDRELEEGERAVREAAARHGARVELVPGALMAVIEGHGAATDQAAAVGRLALELRDLLPSVPIAVATGRAEVGDRSVGEVVERAISRVGTDALPTIGSELPDDGPVVWIDDTTAGLLGPTFVVERGDQGLELRGERVADLQVRTLLGRPTPCVGRERELAFLDATLAECEDDSVARVVLITGPAGVGKSRLRWEWVRRLGERGCRPWICRADPMSAGAPFALFAQLVRTVANLDPTELETSRSRLLARIGRRFDEDTNPRRIAEFLGEMAGLPFPDEERVQLRAARRDAMLMGDQIRRACEDWLGAEAKAEPVVIVLEDLHWGDLPSIQLVDNVLAAHPDLPILVIALARPEVREAFPNLWQARRPLELHVAELTPKAAARLARYVLGDDAPLATIERAVDRAAGNAFFLEEILRAISEGAGDDVPETVLAMVERRLEGLDPEAGRVGRACSARPSGARPSWISSGPPRRRSRRIGSRASPSASS
jgi:predicted Ser/Thr protein kinase